MECVSEVGVPCLGHCVGPQEVDDLVSRTAMVGSRRHQLEEALRTGRPHAGIQRSTALIEGKRSEDEDTEGGSGGGGAAHLSSPITGGRSALR
jgi:hypothetical protein